MKLLQYSEDVRPAYYGTFTKKSHLICGRDPLKQDTDILDYTMDSEAEWEPEGEGEDIHSDEDEDDPNTDMIDPEDANWLVPEGYLSDSEGIEDEEGHTDKSKHKSHTSSKRVAIRKVILGPFFQGEGDEDEVMKPFELQFLVDSPLTGFGYDPFYKEPAPVKLPTTSVDSSFTDEHKTALINVINGKADSIPTLVSEAKSNWLLRDVSKRQLEAKIKDMAIKEKRGTDTKPTWYLKQDEPPATS
ncbi:hypothetical protein K501DRAFT_297893 [Backusella circina FSU 941]|nr:hypothetical protein K501DRAFT_297893 [Backusella circina FSU 941]